MKGLRIQNDISLPRLVLGLLLTLSLLALPACQGAAPEHIETQQTSTTTPDSNLTFRNESRLQEHFQKHGAEVGCSTPEEYLQAANDVICDPATLHKIQDEDGDDAYFRESTGEFVVVSTRGYIRTYFITDRDYFNRQ